MRRLRPTLLILLAAVTLLAAPAAAGPFYLTAKLSDTSLDAIYGRTFQQSVAGEDEGWAVGAGVKLGRYLAIQAEYHDFGSAPGFGSPCNDSADVCIEILVAVRADTTALSLSLLPQLPLTERLSLYGKLGVVSWDSDVFNLASDLRSKIGSFSEEELLLGAGLRFELPGPLDLYAELDQIEDSFETVSFGVTLGY